MPLFTICSPDEKQKTFIIGDCVEEIINKSVQYWNLPDNNYFLISVPDGIEVSNDEILVMLAEMAITAGHPAKLNLMMSQNVNFTEEQILQMPIQFDNATHLSNSIGHIDIINNQSSVNMQTDEVELREDGQMNENVSPKSIHTRNMVPWNRFPKNLIAACKLKKKPTPHDRRRMVTEVVDHMIFVMGDGRRRTAIAIAQAIVNKYPDSFADNINGSMLGDGSETLMKQIYTQINYRNRTKADKASKLKKDTASGAKNQPEYKFDEYGCAAYQPLFTEEENEESQEEKKKELVLLAVKPKRDIRRIKDLLKESYALQRFDFNGRKKLISDVLQEWPLLQEPQYFLDHVNVLMGKDMYKTFDDNINKLSYAFRQFMTNHMFKIFKKNEQTSTSIKTILSTSKNAADDLRSNVPLNLAIFPLIINYFEEEADKLYVVINSELTNDTVAGILESTTPTLVIEGQSLYDENISCAVVIEKKICFKSKKVLTGLAMLFASHYAFNLTYNKNVKKSLEFIQRVFFCLNPDKNNNSCKKRVNSFDTKVKKLWDALKETLNLLDSST